MKLLKRWRHNEQNEQRRSDRDDRSLAKRPQGQDGLTRFRQEVDRVFDRVWKDFDRFGQEPWPALPALGGLSSLSEWSDWPAIDTAEDETNYTVRVDVPGLDPKDLELNVSGNVLTIRGTRDDEWSENKRGVTRRERRSGSFMRSLTLPAYVDAGRIEARYDKGTLTVTAPKTPGKGPRRVPLSA